MTQSIIYRSAGGIRVTRQVEAASLDAVSQLSRALDTRRGLLLASSYEYPGRYKRCDLGFVDPPLSLEARGRAFELRAHGPRGELLLSACASALADMPELSDLDCRSDRVSGVVPASASSFAEEERTRAPSVFTILRRLRALFASSEDAQLGLYGAFGYDLVFQFEALAMQQPRAADARDLVLYLPDRILVRDHALERAHWYRYEFEIDGRSTRDSAPSETASEPAAISCEASRRDHAPGEFARLVEVARGAFARGDLFEVTPSQVFSRPCAARPSEIFARLRQQNPAPYGFVANLGAGEFLIGASPEMYVRVQADRVETCPIAGTIARGPDAIGDARQVQRLLASEKDEAELTMCTDVDRNDKARVCAPGSVRVIGRRQIELYSRLIHTVDHVEGRLREGYDSLDAFITHLWAVTVTGAPKLDAMQFIEAHEKSPRRFYGGALGGLGFDGSVNTGLVLRTIHLSGGVARVRAGATLHFDSDGPSEEAESELKASALFAALDALEPAHVPPPSAASDPPPPSAAGRKPATARLPVLLIDHRDSFVHTLGDYFRQAGCDVRTLRHGFDPNEYERSSARLVVLSPGPARPDSFGMRDTLTELARRELPVFGVCLGLQGMVEFCGGRLRQLETPMHGKASSLRIDRQHPLFAGLPRAFEVGRYHSLYADADTFPSALLLPLAFAPDDTLMAVAHRTRPWWAVQFHPESILSAEGAHGLRLIANVVRLAREHSDG